MPPQSVRLLIVDDDPLVLSSLRLYFGSPAAESIEIVGEANNGAEALSLLESVADDAPVDVVMADVHMPGMDGVGLLSHIRDMPSPPAFIAMTALDEEETMLSLLTQGARGYILKSSRPEFMIDTVLTAVSGGTVVSPQPASRLIRHLPAATADARVQAGSAGSSGGSSPAGDGPDLSPAEEQVLVLVCAGLSNSDISRRADRSASTVKKHVSQLLMKFGATSRVQLAVAAVEAGFRPGDVD